MVVVFHDIPASHVWLPEGFSKSHAPTMFVALWLAASSTNLKLCEKFLQHPPIWVCLKIGHRQIPLEMAILGAWNKSATKPKVVFYILLIAYIIIYIYTQYYIYIYIYTSHYSCTHLYTIDIYIYIILYTTIYVDDIPKFSWPTFPSRSEFGPSVSELTEQHAGFREENWGFSKGFDHLKFNGWINYSLMVKWDFVGRTGTEENYEDYNCDLTIQFWGILDVFHGEELWKLLRGLCSTQFGMMTLTFMGLKPR